MYVRMPELASEEKKGRGGEGEKKKRRKEKGCETRKRGIERGREKMRG